MGVRSDSTLSPSCSASAVKIEGPPDGTVGDVDPRFGSIIGSGVQDNSMSNVPGSPVLSTTGLSRIRVRALARNGIRTPPSFSRAKPSCGLHAAYSVCAVAESSCLERTDSQSLVEGWIFGPNLPGRARMRTYAG